MTPQEIIDGLVKDGLPIEEIAKTLGVAKNSVRAARHADTLPAAWYMALGRMAHRDLPPSAFSFKGMRDAG